MDVLKVIVDKLPNVGCQDCFFLERIDTDYGKTGDYYFCIFEKDDEDWYSVPTVRPIWCPLYPFSSLFNIFEELAKE